MLERRADTSEPTEGFPQLSGWNLLVQPQLFGGGCFKGLGLTLRLTVTTSGVDVSGRCRISGSTRHAMLHCCNPWTPQQCFDGSSVPNDLFEKQRCFITAFKSQISDRLRPFSGQKLAVRSFFEMCGGSTVRIQSEHS